MAFGSGVSFWAFGLYVQPLEEEFGWSRAQVSLGFSAALLVSGLVGPGIGWWIDSRGAKSAILVGSTLTALTYVLLASTSTLWQWYLFQSINAIFRQMMFFIPFQVLVSRWFDRKRGLALSVLATGFSLGGFAVLPLMSLVVSKAGWEGSFVFSGVATAVVFLPLGLFVVKNSPADVGAEVDGAEKPPEGTPSVAMPGVPVGVAIRTPLFWVLASALSLFFYGMFGWLVHQIPFYESVGLSQQAASLVVAASAGIGILVRLGFGLIADRVARFEVLAIALGGFLTSAMITLLLDTGPVGLVVFVGFWVIGAGGGPLMEALLLTRAFGVAYFATILGVVVVVETVGQILSPTLAGAIFDATGSYDWALAMFVGTFLLSMTLFYVALRLPRPDLSSPGSA